MDAARLAGPLLGLAAALAFHPALGQPAPSSGTTAPDRGAPAGGSAAVAADAAAAARAAATGGLAPLLAEADAAYKVRDEPGQLDIVRSRLEQAEKIAPNDYGVLWRLSRMYFWISDDPNLPDGERSKIGKRGWEYGDRASAADPKGVEGWFFAAGGMGNYSLGIGVIKALTQGIEGKFKERLSKAEAIDPKFLDGGIYNAWGRFYYELPWPKYDGEKSEINLYRAITVNPANVRARVYLAELYTKEDHPKNAKQQLEKALAHPPGAYDAPEERRYQARARAILAKMK